MADVERKPEQTYSVLMIDSSSFGSVDGSGEWWVRGFPTLELATEYARRWVRSCVGEARRDLNDPLAWRQVGENATVPGHYDAADEAQFFAANPATSEEIDWKAIKCAAGLDTETDPK